MSAPCKYDLMPCDGVTPFYGTTSAEWLAAMAEIWGGHNPFDETYLYALRDEKCASNCWRWQLDYVWDCTGDEGGYWRSSGAPYMFELTDVTAPCDDASDWERPDDPCLLTAYGPTHAFPDMPTLPDISPDLTFPTTDADGGGGTALDDVCCTCCQWYATFVYNRTTCTWSLSETPQLVTGKCEDDMFDPGDYCQTDPDTGAIAINRYGPIHHPLDGDACPETPDVDSTTVPTQPVYYAACKAVYEEGYCPNGDRRISYEAVVIACDPAGYDCGGMGGPNVQYTIFGNPFCTREAAQAFIDAADNPCPSGCFAWAQDWVWSCETDPHAWVASGEARHASVDCGQEDNHVTVTGDCTRTTYGSVVDSEGALSDESDAVAPGEDADDSICCPTSGYCSVSFQWDNGTCTDGVWTTPGWVVVAGEELQWHSGAAAEGWNYSGDGLSVVHVGAPRLETEPCDIDSTPPGPPEEPPAQLVDWEEEIQPYSHNGILGDGITDCEGCVVAYEAGATFWVALSSGHDVSETISGQHTSGDLVDGSYGCSLNDQGGLFCTEQRYTGNVRKVCPA